MATLNIRNIDDDAAERIKRAAAARQMTLGAYIAALADLHRRAVDAPDEGMRRLLDASGLAAVIT